MKFTEKFHRRRSTSGGKAVSFAVDEVILPDGKRAIREYLVHPGAVAVVALLPGDRVVLVRQYRYPVKEVTYELPAGKIDPGERPSSCVRRELAEETGYRARRVKKLLSYWPTSAFSDEVIHIYLAEGLTPAGRCPDEDEFLEVVELPFEEALELVRRGRIRDSKTVIGLLSWNDRRRARKR